MAALTFLLSFSVGFVKIESWRPILDIAIFLDTGCKSEYDWNGSAIPVNLAEEIEFCNDFVKAFEVIGPNATQLGLITFNVEARIDLQWKDSNVSTYISAVKKIEAGGETKGANFSNVTKAMILHNKGMMFDGRGMNYVIIILRADNVEGDAVVTSKTLDFKSDLIVIDYRSIYSRSDKPANKIFGPRMNFALVPTVNESAVSEIVNYIKRRECQYHAVPDVCYYTDKQRSTCEMTFIRPAEKYGEKCTGAFPSNQSKHCLPSTCNETCDKGAPWEDVCVDRVCGRWHTRSRTKLSGGDYRLIYCDPTSEIFCPCPDAHLDSSTIHAVVAVRMTLFLGFVIAAIIMIILHFTKGEHAESSRR